MFTKDGISLYEMLSNIPLSIISLDENMNIIYINRLLLDHPMEAVIGSSAFDFIDESHHSDVKKCLLEVKENNKGGEITISLRSGDIIKWIDCKVVLINKENGYEYLIIADDITDDILTMNELKSRIQKLESNNRELEKFAYVTSHDLKSPIHKISAFVSLLYEQIGDDLTPTAKKYMEFIATGSNRVLELVDALMSLSSASNTGIAKRDINLSIPLEYAINNMNLYIVQNPVTINIGDMCSAYVDPKQITLLLQNLIVNGIKYNISENKVLDIFCTETDSTVDLHVKDNGIGIEDKYFDKIFDAFSRLHSESEFSGTGIGLSICKKVADQHGASILVNSVVGEGTEFLISFQKEITL